MIEILAQFDGKSYTPYTLDDKEKAKEHKPNQIVKIKASGSEKERSYPQLQRYWVLCHKAAIVMSDHENILTRLDVDFKVKIRVAKKHPSMIKRFQVVDGSVFMEPISISFKNMKHLLACKFFDLADRELELLTGYIGETIGTQIIKGIDQLLQVEG